MCRGPNSHQIASRYISPRPRCHSEAPACQGKATEAGVQTSPIQQFACFPEMANEPEYCASSLRGILHRPIFSQVGQIHRSSSGHRPEITYSPEIPSDPRREREQPVALCLDRENSYIQPLLLTTMPPLI